MKSIKTKIMGVLLLCILLSSIAVGSAGILSAGKVVDENTMQIMNLHCQENAQKIDHLLSRIEQSVQTVADYATMQLTDIKRFQTDADYVDTYTAQVKDVLLNAAKHTDGASTVYIRYNPDFTAPTSGLFFTLSDNGHTENTPTDFSKYDSSDTERVGWYYIPVKNDAPTWMPPYWNQNIQLEMISFVIPLQVEGITIGVIGMDIDYAILTDILDNTTIFQSGYAFLLDNQSHILYHKDHVVSTPLADIETSLQPLASKILKQGTEENFVTYQYQGEERKAVFQKLKNDMNLVLTAPSKEIMTPRTELIHQIIVITLIVGTLTLFLTYLMAVRIAKPLLELNVAAKKIADGDLEVTITHHSNDEIGVLAESFRKTASRLSEYIHYIRGLAYRDSLTGSKSKMAYLEAVEKLSTEINITCPTFAIAVFDLNGLKQINDRYGHDTGDMQIIAASKIICKVFSGSPVFRIGGDEFVSILSGNDLANTDKLFSQFEYEIAEHNSRVKSELHVSIARGIATYGPGRDLTYQDVFKRADTAMYQNKEHMKKIL